MSRLPPAPDFNAIDAVAPQTADQRTNILTLIGNLIFSWSNNESMFIYLLMVLLKTDFNSAAITFITLNTTRARLDLIRRLAKSKSADPQIVRRIERLIERFNRCTRIRNEFNHCIYRVDDKGNITHADMLRVVEKKDGLSIVTTKEFDDKRIREIVNTIRSLKQLNRDIWEFLPELERAIG
ncbi:hypothetical protein [Oricola sp.]|uniref:hypothetical protein n=1 Tax=Oricola sp. TaxID=1979950 RepID=UPI003BA8D99D